MTRHSTHHYTTMSLPQAVSPERAHRPSVSEEDEIIKGASDCRVLSIQSHVVSGYVGNKSATFPLQVLGFEVDTINSVQFSNHTGYGPFKGQILGAEDLGELYEGLQENRLIQNYTHLLTGYIGSKSFLLKVAELAKHLKKTCPGLIYVCDPVMGDMGKMYVPKELLPVYRDTILPLADIITPNQFEAEMLSGIQITNLNSACEAMSCLHSLGTGTVVISSTELGSDDVLIGLGSSLHNGHQTRIQLDIPRYPLDLTGTGDLFAALLLAWLHAYPNNLKLACEKVVSTMQSVIDRTYTTACELAGEGNKPNLAQKELRLVQSKRDIENAVLCVKATSL